MNQRKQNEVLTQLYIHDNDGDIIDVLAIYPSSLIDKDSYVINYAIKATTGKYSSVTSFIIKQINANTVTVILS